MVRWYDPDLPATQFVFEILTHNGNTKMRTRNKLYNLDRNEEVVFSRERNITPVTQEEKVLLYSKGTRLDKVPSLSKPTVMFCSFRPDSTQLCKFLQIQVRVHSVSLFHEL